MKKYYQFKSHPWSQEDIDRQNEYNRPVRIGRRKAMEKAIRDADKEPFEDEPNPKQKILEPTSVRRMTNKELLVYLQAKREEIQQERKYASCRVLD